MSENNSWVKLFRKFKEWGWYSDINVSRLFLHLLLSVNYEDKDWKGVVVKRGQVIVGVEDLGEQTGLSRQQTRTALTKLKSTNEITIKTTTKYTLITVNKYNDYQQITNNLTNEQPTDNQQITTTKEYKNKRIKENNNISIETRKKKHLYKTDEVTDLMCKEIAEKYQVSLKDVLNTRERMILYCGSTGTQYADYKLTLMNFVRSAIDRGQVRKIQMVKTYTPEMITITEEQRKKNSEKIAEIKNKFPIKTAS